ncbi:MAG TPA: DUF2235 domain-containing protein [Noviherbaspirillum sp.]|nr:DUF2235 domain-containing protein [Noviherbaspirillum sp.]
MSAFIVDRLNGKEINPSERNRFFDESEDQKIRSYSYSRECSDNTFPPSCDLNLFFGFFFDGTNNNLKLHREAHTHSNVARLYSAFPGGRDNHGSETWPELKSKYHNSFFRTYIPGVGTKFEEVGDSGEGYRMTDDRPKGLAFCYKGENRIIWSLVQALNNIHVYYTDVPLIDDKKFKEEFNELTLPSFREVTRPSFSGDEWESGRKSELELLRSAFKAALSELHAGLKNYLPVGEGKSRSKGVVKNIYVSMFGFSRGATKARVFSNWFNWLCMLDAELCGSASPSLGTIPVTVDFLGLFDTVASVGLAAAMPFVDGHQAWADAESSLKIPGDIGPAPARCLHLVSGHEIRRSFPLDSIRFKSGMPDNCTEIVFPGVHSDVGGGYGPSEQGRGKDPEGSDLISRIALAVMYRAARLSGVPLKLEEAPDSVKKSFRIAPEAIDAFNAYLDAYRSEQRPVTAPLHELMEHQHALYIRWRKQMAGKMHALPGFERWDKHDREDIVRADEEFRKEIGYFSRWRDRERTRYDRRPEMPTVPEWADVARYWDGPPPPPAVAEFFERFVHDSRAWFKPLGQDVADLQHALELLAIQEENEREWDQTKAPYEHGPNPYRLTRKERERLLNYKRSKDLYPEKKDHRDAIDPESKGREPMWLGGGYLRYRRVYMGSDSYRPSGAKYAGLAPTPDNPPVMLAACAVEEPTVPV